MATRCKMHLENVFGNTWGGVKAFFRCVYDEELSQENRDFAKATPNGMAEFEVSNPAAAEQLVIGKYYYFDITPVEDGQNG